MEFFIFFFSFLLILSNGSYGLYLLCLLYLRDIKDNSKPDTATLPSRETHTVSGNIKYLMNQWVHLD